MRKDLTDYSYTASILANEVNITPEGLRYYEKRGIGRAVKKENGYRTYHPQEVVVLRLIRNLTRYGFSLKEAIDLVTCEPFEIEGFLAALQEKKEQLRKKIMDSQFILERLEQQIDIVSHIDEDKGKVWFEEIPAFYYLEYYTGVYASTKKKLSQLMHKWMELMPIAYPMPILTQEALEKGENTFASGGFAIDMEKLPDSSYFDDEYCRLYPEHLYLCTISRQVNLTGVSINEPSVQKAFDTMRQMHLKVDGNVFFQSVAAFESRNEINMYYKILIPVSPQ